MYQKWRDLSFLHISIDPDEMQKVLPKGLTVDTFPDAAGNERAWLGLVPFWMKGIRRRGLSAIPGLSSFPETNVRTYVHRNGKEPGVWFFSLDAANPIACAYARRFFALPYHDARMLVDNSDPAHIKYACTRSEDGSYCNATVQVQLPVAPPQPGSLEFFLIERYLLYSVRKGSLFSGRVFHKPYPLKAAELHGCSEDLTRIVPFRKDEKQSKQRHWEHAIYSPGVDVAVYKLQPVKR